MAKTNVYCLLALLVPWYLMLLAGILSPCSHDDGGATAHMWPVREPLRTHAPGICSAQRRLGQMPCCRCSRIDALRWLPHVDARATAGESAAHGARCAGGRPQRSPGVRGVSASASVSRSMMSSWRGSRE